MEDNKDIISSINWNNIIKLDARSIDRAILGQVQGLFEPCVVVEKGTLNKETYYIPKSVIEKYDNEALFFRLTEQEVKDYCLRDSPPSEEDAEHIRITAERIASTQRSIELQSENQEEEVLKKLMEAVSEFKDRVSLRAKWAKEKLEESQIQKDEQKISKMGELSAVFTDSFDQVMSEIKISHTYAEQEQIYDGFMKLLEQQRELLSARMELASKLKSSITQPLSSDKNGTKSVESPEMEGTRKQSLEGEVVSLESITQPDKLVLPANEAPNTYKSRKTITDSNTKGEEGLENRFMVIEPQAIKYSRVTIKRLPKKAKKRLKVTEKENQNDSNNVSQAIFTKK